MVAAEMLRCYPKETVCCVRPEGRVLNCANLEAIPGLPNSTVMTGIVRQAAILGGGRGTRLGSLAGRIPKPLMPIVGDRRFLDVLVDHVARQGFSDILLLAGHLGDQIAHRYSGGSVRGARVRVVIEPTPR